MLFVIIPWTHTGKGACWGILFPPVGLWRLHTFLNQQAVGATSKEHQTPYVPGRALDRPDSEGGVREDNYFCSPCGGWLARRRWCCGSNFIGSITECHFIVPSLFVANQSIKNTTLHVWSQMSISIQNSSQFIAILKLSSLSLTFYHHFE